LCPRSFRGRRAIHELGRAAAHRDRHLLGRLLLVDGRDLRAAEGCPARDLAALAPGEMQAGVQTLLWNGMSNSGAKAPAGVYVVEAVAKGKDGRCSRATTMLKR
jgi:hypothetical protein